MEATMERRSRHPKINYWFWFDKTVESGSYRETLERIAKNSNFDTLTLTDRGCDFWDPTHKKVFAELVSKAHELGLKIVLQIWPKSVLFTTASVDVADAGAMIVDKEATVTNGKALLRSVSKWVRTVNITPEIGTELVKAYAFIKTADGRYDADTLVDVTDRAKTEYVAPNRLSVSFSLPEYEGYTVFAMFAHYHRVFDLFSGKLEGEYKEIMDYYADVPFDGIALDEFKGLSTAAPWTLEEGDPFRGRVYGKHFSRYFKEKRQRELERTLFDMRYCPEGKDVVRITAINEYFDVFRRAPLFVEHFVTDYSKKLFGENAFLGFHNTFHNSFTNDELWADGCCWWETKRDYAQTDENMIFPVRLGLACQTKNAINYDMYYHKDRETFFEKAIKDAPYGGRIHYHAIDDGSTWGVDTGSAEFLADSLICEDNAELLNIFEPVMPVMPLLTVFGFPALCNWYPDESARNEFDTNGSLGIMEKANDMWKSGLFNALSTDDAIIDGRITLTDDGKFDYCGNKFEAMLFMAPEYSKPETVAFLKKAVDAGAKIRVIGTISKYFDGTEADGGFLSGVTVDYDCDIAKELSLELNDIAGGCRLTDGSVVMSSYDSVKTGKPHTARFSLNGDEYEVSYIGCFAMKKDGESLVCGELADLKKNGKTYLPDVRGKNVTYNI